MAPEGISFSSFRSGSPRRFLLESHLCWHPKPDTSAHEAQPHHQIVLLGAVVFRHGLPDEAGVDEEAGDAGNRVVLVKERKGKMVC